MKKQLTFLQAHNALIHLQKRQMGNQLHKPDLLNVKGDTALQVYRLKNALQDAFKPHIERLEDLRSDGGGNGRAEEFKALEGETEQVEIPMLQWDDIKDHCDADIIDDLDFAIQFEPVKDKK